MTRLATVTLAACALLLPALFATSPLEKAASATPSQTSASAGTSAAPGQNPATLADFAWLAGRWQGDWGPRVAEQDWMAPKSGLMLGTFRLVEDDKTLVIELFSLLQKPDGIQLRFRHFTPELTAWEKSDPTLLTLESFNATKFTFVNPLNGQPKHAILTRIDPDTYLSRSEIVADSGALQVIEITYHRQNPPTGGAAPKGHPTKH